MKPLRLLVLALGAVFLGGMTYAALVFATGAGSRDGSAFASATCSVTGPNGAGEDTATVAIVQNSSTATTTTLGQDSSGDLLVDGNPCSTSVTLTSSTYISEIALNVSGTGSGTVVLDQTQPGGPFPAHTEIDTPLTDTLSNDTLQVNAAGNEVVVVGTTGVNLTDTAPTSADPVGTINGIGAYTLVGGTGSGTTLDASGGVGTGSGVQANFIAGDSSETFKGGATGSTLDFSQLTCPSSPANSCTVTANSTGSTVNGVTKFNAELFGATPLQSYTYTFTDNEADFTEVNGNSSIPTTWSAPPSSTTTYTLDSNVTLQGNAGSYTVTSSGSGNQVSAGSGTESFTVNGGNVTMTGANGSGNSTDTFTSTGSDNTFVAGTLADSFFDSGANNTVSFANLSTSTNPLLIDADSNNSTDSAAGIANLNGVKYTFLNSSTFLTTSGAGPGADSDFTTFDGANSGNTTFQADSAGGLTFQGAGTTNTADFTSAGNPITANLSGSTITTSNNTQVPSGEVLVSCPTCAPAAIDSISNVGTVKGDNGGSNTFWGGTGSMSFVAKSSNNTVNGASGGTYQIDMSGSGHTGNAVNAGVGTENFTVTGNGITMTGGTGTGSGSATFTDATGTGNTFVPGSFPDFFYDGASPNTVDFSGVGTSPQDQLAVNVAGSPEAATLTTSGGAIPVTIQNGQAEVGTGTVYTFLNSSTATGPGAASDFTVLKGPSSGNTQFLAGSEFTSGVPMTFQGGSGGSNSLSFPTENNGVTVNLINGPASTGSAVAAGSLTTDSLTGITTVTGSPSGGNTFTAGGPFTLGGSSTYDFIGNGDGNDFIGGGGTDIFTSNGNGNTFYAGTGQGTFQDPTGTGNTVDFSKLTSAAVTVNVTGGPVGSLGSTDEASASLIGGITKYFFSGFGANDAAFVGASGSSSQTTFLAGSSGDTFTGGQSGAPSDTLSFADATGNSLQVCTTLVTGTCSSGQAILGRVAENFSGVKIIDGLGTGDTTFAADDATGGYVFNGAGAGNTADFSNAVNSVQANLVTGKVSFSSLASPDTISDVSTVFGSATGGNTFKAANAAETFGDEATSIPPSNGADTIDFSNLQTVPLTQLTVNANGGGTSPYTATFGQSTYNFATGGPNFTNFIGAGGGFTTFVAGNTPDYSFAGRSGNNSIDFSADASPIVANLSTGTVTLNPGSDTISGIATVTGSPNGGNTFVAGTGQNETYKGGQNNTVDLSALTSPAVVNVSQAGQSPQSTAFGTATSSGTIYDFTAFESAQTTFKGSTGGTTFYAGPTADSFQGKSSSDTLSFADAPGTSLSICQAASVTAGCASGQAVLGTTTQTFQSIKTFVGLATQGSNTAFYADDTTGGKVFSGQAGTNTADFTAAALGVAADMTKNTVTFSPSSPANGKPDTISDVTTVYGSQNGGNTFIASPSASETFGDLGSSPTSGDSISFTHILGTTSVNPLTVDASLSTTASGVAPFTAQFGSLTYSFATGGTNFTSFTGSASGNTDFEAAATTSGLTFSGSNAGNVGDFSLSSGITADMSSGQVVLSAGIDTLSGAFSKVVGSPSGANTFYGALTGTQFTSSSSSNTVSYALQATGVTFNLPSSQVSGSAGTPDTFSFPSTGRLTVQGSPASDTFQIGSRAVTLEGGGGQDTVDLSQVSPPTSGTVGVTANMGGATGSITGSTIGGATFTPGCGSATALCVTSLIGTVDDDTYVANQTLDPSNPLTITSGGGNDTLKLQRIGSPAVVDMPITTGTPTSNPGTCSGVPAGDGAVCSGAGAAPGILFTGIENVVGTSSGGDDFFAGQGSQVITEPGNVGTLDSSVVPSTPNSSDTIAGISIFATQGAGGAFTGTVSSSPAIGETVTFNNIGTFVGTQDNDTFTQTGTGPVTNSSTNPPTGYVFDGEGGNNTIDLSSVPTGQVALQSPTAGDGCTTPPSGSGIPNPNDVLDTVSGVTEDFTCIGSVTSSASEYQVSPGQTASVNGGGTGTIDLISPPGDPQTVGCGVTVTMPVGSTAGTVQSNGCSDYNFSFTGVSKVIGTTYNDLFVPGSSSATFVGNGGSDSTSFAGATAAAVVNLSGSPYTVPAGDPYSGTVVPADHAIGGDGGTGVTVALQGVFNAIASGNGDVLIGGPGVETLTGGAGNDTFVPTGGNYTIKGGAGSNTIDLSLLPGYTTLDLGSGATQYPAPGDGSIQLLPSTIQKAIASPAGSALQAGNINGITLIGSGNDWLGGGFADNQTLIGNGAGDTLVAGIGNNETLEGGSSPVTFVPGLGTETLTSPITGNTLSYAGDPFPAQVNLSGAQYSTLQPQTASGGYGATVNLSAAGITSVVGSSANDTFVTGSGGENINGGGGNDLFVVGSGNNTLTAANGTASRFLITGPGSNIIHGGGAATIDFSQAPSGVTINLLAGSATGGWSGTTTMTGVLNAIGSNFNDKLIAGAAHATLTGNAGKDTLQVSPAGADTLDGSKGDGDTFCAQAGSCPGMSYNPASGSTMLGSSQPDSFFAANGVVDVIHTGTSVVPPDDFLSVDAGDRVFNP